MTTQPKKKPLLQAVVDILDISLDILKNHPDTGKDSIGAAEKEIEKVKKAIAKYKDEQAAKPYPKPEDINWH
ncbi:hypothetical protein [Planktothrix sp.]|uniref:hypothetical protein n=1 Tax=Planktothrix sp. TaxID=3088171 RepID=UPI0038D3F906